jgi:hypothetical protein
MVINSLENRPLLNGDSEMAKYAHHKRQILLGYRSFTVVLMRPACLAGWSSMERGLDIKSVQVMAPDKLEAVSCARLDLVRSDLGEGADEYIRLAGLPALKSEDYQLVCLYPGHHEVSLYGHQYRGDTDEASADSAPPPTPR